jgi:hypothetical protein
MPVPRLPVWFVVMALAGYMRANGQQIGFWTHWCFEGLQRLAGSVVHTIAAQFLRKEMKRSDSFDENEKKQVRTVAGSPLAYLGVRHGLPKCCLSDDMRAQAFIEHLGVFDTALELLCFLKSLVDDKQ